MARTALQKIYADFRQGFVTVANPLAFPEGSLKDIVNFDIQDNGTLALRPGLRQDTDTVVDTGLSLSEVNNLALSIHVWDNVNNNGDERIAVVQVGSKLYFYPMLESGIDLSAPVKVEGVALGSGYDIGIPSTGIKTAISTTSGSGWLFVTHPDKKPFLLKKPVNEITSTDITLRVRDLSLWEGKDLPNGDTADQVTGLLRGDTLYPQHRYNLINAGWPDQPVQTSNRTNADSGTGLRNPIGNTFFRLGIYPNIGTPFASGKAGGGATVSEQIAYSPWQIENDYFGNSIPPLGKNIVDAERWFRVGIGNTPFYEGETPVTYRKRYEWEKYPTSVEFYADRIWYSGAKGYLESELTSETAYRKDDNIDISTTIYFSQQILNNLEKVNKCYQENDPTAEDINQLLATDGGTLAIRGAGNILDMKTFGASLVVFATEGIWSISGLDNNSFTADSISVNKISNIGPSAKNTISATDNSIYYIANDAIYTLSVDEITGNPSPKDITSAKIKNFYNEIPYKNKEKARAFFDVSNRNLYVFYSDITTPSEAASNISYNKCLVFNQDLNAFYKYEINIGSHYIVDGLFYNKDQTVTLVDNVISDLDNVVSDTDNVALLESYSTASLNNVQLLTVVDNAFGTNAGFTSSSFTDITYRLDWGVSYKAHAEFGFDVAGDIMRDSKKAPVIISHMERTEDGFELDGSGNLVLSNRSGCLLSYGWDWATNYKNPIQLYRFNRNYVPSGTVDPFNYGVDVITTRNRIRGKGYSLGIRLDSEPGKDCKVLGLGIMYTAAQRV